MQPSAARPRILFVYGTLLSGEANHRLMAAAEPRGAACTGPAFELFDMGSFPALVAGGATAVAGELYLVHPPLLAELDAFEGHPHLYTRASVLLREGEADAYLFGADQVRERAHIPGGDWRAHRQETQHKGQGARGGPRR